MPGPRPHVLHEATYRQLLKDRPNLAVLPWGPPKRMAGISHMAQT